MDSLNAKSDPFYPRTNREYFGQLVSGLIVFIKQSPNAEVAAAIADCIADVALKLDLSYEESFRPRE